MVRVAPFFDSRCSTAMKPNNSGVSISYETVLILHIIRWSLTKENQTAN